MVLIMRLKKYINPACIFAFFLMVGACNEYLGPIVDCDECFNSEPDSADLVIYVTLNNEHPEVPIVVYRETMEGNQVDWVDTVRKSPYYLWSDVDQYYSVTAEYSVGDGKIIAVDGDRMKVKHVRESCDFDCWIIKGGYLKVELKFDD